LRRGTKKPVVGREPPIRLNTLFGRLGRAMFLTYQSIYSDVADHSKATVS
jgi:hypothetical protein